MLAADVFQANVVLVKCWNFLLQVSAEQAHEKVHFAPRTLLPIFFRESVKREGGNFDAGGRFHRGAHRGHTGAVTGHARQMTATSPAPVAIHNNGDVSGKPFGIKPQVNFRLLVVESGGNSCLQA